MTDVPVAAPPGKRDAAALLADHEWPDEPRYAPGRCRAHDPDREGPVRLVVLGDSFSFTDEAGPQLPDAPGLWPNVAREHLARMLDLDVRVQVLARPARTVREALDLVRKDRHVQFEVLAHAHAVVVALGSYDHAPMGVPGALQALVPHLRPPRLRRTVRDGLHTAYPWLVRATRGRFTRTPASTFDRAYDALLAHVRAVAHGAAGVALGPSSHRSSYYGDRHDRFGERAAGQLARAEAQGFTPLSAWERVRPHVEHLNPDGIHWPLVAHDAVGRAVATALAPQLSGDAARPPRPGRGEEHGSDVVSPAPSS